MKNIKMVSYNTRLFLRLDKNKDGIVSLEEIENILDNFWADGFNEEEWSNNGYIASELDECDEFPDYDEVEECEDSINECNMNEDEDENLDECGFPAYEDVEIEECNCKKALKEEDDYDQEDEDYDDYNEDANRILDVDSDDDK